MAAMDPISDFLTRIRNAQMAVHETVTLPHSILKEALVRILKQEGYIAGFKVDETGRFKSLIVTLKYLGDREPAIRLLKRVSKPGRRVHVKKDEIPPVLGGLGINILSTSRGLMTGKEARTQSVGGEILCEVY